MRESRFGGGRAVRGRSRGLGLGLGLRRWWGAGPGRAQRSEGRGGGAIGSALRALTRYHNTSKREMRHQIKKKKWN